MQGVLAGVGWEQQNDAVMVHRCVVAELTPNNSKYNFLKSRLLSRGRIESLTMKFSLSSLTKAKKFYVLNPDIQ